MSKFHAAIGMTPLIYCLSMGLSVALKTNKMLWILVKANWYIIFEYLKGYVTHNVYNVKWVHIYEQNTSFHFTSIQTLVTTKAKSMVGRKHDSMVITGIV